MPDLGLPCSRDREGLKDETPVDESVPSTSDLEILRRYYPEQPLFYGHSPVDPPPAFTRSSKGNEGLPAPDGEERLIRAIESTERSPRSLTTMAERFSRRFVEESQQSLSRNRTSVEIELADLSLLFPANEPIRGAREDRLARFLESRQERAAMHSVAFALRDLPAYESIVDWLQDVESKWLRWSWSYGGYSAREEVRSPRVPARGETLEEEIRREGARGDTGFRPFQAGRLTLRGNLTGFEGNDDLLQLVYRTQDLRVIVTPGRTRVSCGRPVLGWNADVFSSLRYSGRLRHGIELERPVGDKARVRIVGGGSSGSQPSGPDALDVFEITGDRAFAFLAYERRF